MVPGRRSWCCTGCSASSQNWTAIARRLADQFHVFTLDLRNHGASPWTKEMGYRAMAEDVAAFIAAHRLARAAIIGHSLGGKVGMALALMAPERVERLVVVDIAPVARLSTLSVYVEAMRALDLRGVNRRSAADALLRPRIPDPAIRLFLLQNLVSGPEGLHWRLNLQCIADEMDEILSFPAFAAGVSYGGPTLLVRGGASDYVEDRDLPVFAGLFPNFALVTVPDAGHWIHAERPDEFLAAVTPFLSAAV